VDQEVRPYDWRGPRAAPLLTAAVVETIDAPAETPAPVPAPVDEPRLAAIERDAHAEGFEQGERAGTEAAGITARGLLRRLAATIDELSSTRQDVLRRTERQVVELAMAIAKHMLQRELNVDRGLLLAMARVALDGLGDHEAATIRLHPDDYALARASADREWASDQVTVVADPVVEQGGCLVQCAGGLMKVGLESQFNELARALLGEQGGDRADRAEVRHGATAPS